jgi:hypothetical protein
MRAVLDTGIMSTNEEDHPRGELQRTILELLSHRRAGATICPSEAARAVAGSGKDWRPLMVEARSAAAALVEAGEVVITQHGEVVDLATARGPVRIRRA